VRAYEFLSEAGLSVGDLRKRDNLQLFMDMIGKGEPFVKVGETEPSVVLQPSDELMMKLQKNDIPYIFDTTDDKQIRLSNLFKTNSFGGAGNKKDTSERQEHGLINIINANAGAKISQMDIIAKSAHSYGGMNSMGKEQYIDIFITDSDGKDHGISMKGMTSITIGGGGTAGIVSMFPDLITKVYNRIEDYLKVDMELEDDDIVPHTAIPDLYLSIPENYVIELMKGNEEMGGPIEWIYVGPSDVKGEVVDNELNLNGKFYSVENFIEEMGGADQFYFRMRKRDAEGEHTQIDYVTTGKFELPILMKNEVNDRRNWRLLMTKGRPKNSIVLDF